MSEKSLGKKLSEIQQKMKAPKNLYNSFGKYNYRNAESILEAFKPFENEYKVFLVVGDDIVSVGDRIYVKATACLQDCESEENIYVTAFAREASEKKVWTNRRSQERHPVTRENTHLTVFFFWMIQRMPIQTNTQTRRKP